MSTDPRPRQLSPLQEGILAAVASGGNLAPRDIAERAGVLCSGFFLAVLEGMADRQILWAEAGRYGPIPGPRGIGTG